MQKKSEATNLNLDKGDFESKGGTILNENSIQMQEYGVEEPELTTIPEIDLSDFKETYDIFQSIDKDFLKSIYGADEMVPLEPIIEPLSLFSSLNQAGENLLKLQKQGRNCRIDPNIRPYEIFKDSLVPILKKDLANTYENDRNQHFWHSTRFVTQTLKDIERLPLKEIDILTYQTTFNDSITSIINQMEKLELIPLPTKLQDYSKPIKIIASEEARGYFSQEAMKSRNFVFSQAIGSGLFKFKQLPADLQNEFQSLDKEHENLPIKHTKTKHKKNYQSKTKLINFQHPKKKDANIDDSDHVLRAHSQFLNLPPSYKPKFSDSDNSPIETRKTIKLSPITTPKKHEVSNQNHEVVTPVAERNLKKVEIITRPFTRHASSLGEKKISPNKTQLQIAEPNLDQSLPEITLPSKSQTAPGTPVSMKMKSKEAVIPMRSEQGTEMSMKSNKETLISMKMKPKEDVSVSLKSNLKQENLLNSEIVLSDNTESTIMTPHSSKMKPKSKSAKISPNHRKTSNRSKVKSKSKSKSVHLTPISPKSELTPVSSFSTSTIPTPTTSMLDFDSFDIDHALTYACNTPVPMSGIQSRNGSSLNTARPINSYENIMKRGIFWNAMDDPLQNRSGKYVDQLMLLHSLSDIPLDNFDSLSQKLSKEEDYEPFKMISRPQSPPSTTENDIDHDPEWQPTPFEIEKNIDKNELLIEKVDEDITKEEAVKYLQKLNVEIESEEIGKKTYDRLNEIWSNFGFTIQERMGMISKYTESMNMITNLQEILSVWESLFSLFNNYENAYKSFVSFMKMDFQSMNNRNFTISLLYNSYREAEEKLENATGILKSNFGNEDLLIKGKRINDYTAIRKSKTRRMMKQIGFDPY